MLLNAIKSDRNIRTSIVITQKKKSQQRRKTLKFLIGISLSHHIALSDELSSNVSMFIRINLKLWLIWIKYFQIYNIYVSKYLFKNESEGLSLL